ncbi:hypothetical protein AGMMS50212_05310 [Spirochaetia bacterium]|nr:hypothetical protein AGMMS50212_05310 [Spirochaetia bacterium]
MSLPRIYFIDRKIAGGEFPNTQALAEEWETSISTITRDIEFMKTQLGAPIEYNAGRRGYYYAGQTYRLPAGYTTAEEMLAVGMAKNLLSLYKNTPIFEAASHLFESITAPMNAGRGQWYEDRLIVPPFPSSPVPLEAWNMITSAVQENRVLTFDYCGAKDEIYQRRRVDPYQLIFNTGVWNLYGFSHERGAKRLFSLFRMKNIALLKETFTLPVDFDWRKDVEGSNFGVFSSGEKQRFRIAFFAGASKWVRERRWADDQTIEEMQDGVIIEFSSGQAEKILGWVLGCGANAKPLEPESLVADWKRTVREMVKLSGE